MEVGIYILVANKAIRNKSRYVTRFNQFEYFSRIVFCGPPWLKFSDESDQVKIWQVQ